MGSLRWDTLQRLWDFDDFCICFCFKRYTALTNLHKCFVKPRFRICIFYFWFLHTFMFNAFFFFQNNFLPILRLFCVFKLIVFDLSYFVYHMNIEQVKMLYIQNTDLYISHALNYTNFRLLVLKKQVIQLNSGLSEYNEVPDVFTLYTTGVQPHGRL